MWELNHKETECWRIDAFELLFWRRLLRISWTARRSNQSILKDISPEYSLEELMLKLQYFGHLMWRADSFEKTLMLGKIWGREEKGTTEDEMVGWHHRLDGHGSGWTSGVGDGQGDLVCCCSWCHKLSETTERLDWTEYNYTNILLFRDCIICTFLPPFTFNCSKYLYSFCIFSKQHMARL